MFFKHFGQARREREVRKLETDKKSLLEGIKAHSNLPGENQFRRDVLLALDSIQADPKDLDALLADPGFKRLDDLGVRLTGRVAGIDTPGRENSAIAYLQDHVERVIQELELKDLRHHHGTRINSLDVEVIAFVRAVKTAPEPEVMAEVAISEFMHYRRCLTQPQARSPAPG